MKVILTTQGGGDDHPYISQLTAALTAKGVQVNFARPGLFTLWRSVRAYGRPDVFHLQWQHPLFLASRFDKIVWRTAWFFVQLLTLRLLGVKFVWTVHELVHFGTRRAGWELMASRLLARAADGLIVHGESVIPIVADALHVAPGRLRVIPHGHFADHYPPPMTKTAARRALGWPDDARIFLSFGHIRTYKGFDRLVRSFAQLAGADRVRLVLAGKPHVTAKALVNWLEEQAAKDGRIMTHFAYIPDEQLVVYLSACDLVVLPYSESLTSGAAILAASYGRAILAPQLGCMGEFPPEAALLYDPEEPEGLQRALGRALTAPLGAMGAAAKQYITQFPWSQIAHDTLALYRSTFEQTPDPNPQPQEAFE